MWWKLERDTRVRLPASASFWVSPRSFLLILGFWATTAISYPHFPLKSLRFRAVQEGGSQKPTDQLPTIAPAAQLLLVILSLLVLLVMLLTTLPSSRLNRIGLRWVVFSLDVMHGGDRFKLLEKASGTILLKNPTAAKSRFNATVTYCNPAEHARCGSCLELDAAAVERLLLGRRCCSWRKHPDGVPNVDVHTLPKCLLLAPRTSFNRRAKRQKLFPPEVDLSLSDPDRRPLRCPRWTSSASTSARQGQSHVCRRWATTEDPRSTGGGGERGTCTCSFYLRGISPGHAIVSGSGNLRLRRKYVGQVDRLSQLCGVDTCRRSFEASAGV